MKKILTSLLLLLSTSGFAATLNPVQLLNPAGSSAGQTIVSTGSATAPGWATVPLSGLSSIAANTVLANATASSAAPAAFAMPSCSATTSALNWTTSSGFTCNNFVNAGTLGGFTWAVPGALGATTPNSGAFTTLSATGAFTPSQTAGIVGTTTNNNANTGSVGELVSSGVTGTSLTTATSKTSVSISLTAGDWDAECTNTFNPAGSTTVSLLQSGVSVVNNTLPAANAGAAVLLQATLPTGAIQIQSTQRTRFNLATTTTIYCIAVANFGASTMTVDGFIRARRVR